MKDITELFKATVKTVRSRRKKAGLKVDVDKSILPVKKEQSKFTKKATDVVSY